MLTLGERSGFQISLQITILVAETALPWENSASLLGETTCIPWQNLVCCRWFTARFIKYSHPEEIPLFEGATPVRGLPTLHTTHKHTHMKRLVRGEDRPCPTEPCSPTPHTLLTRPS